MKARLDGSRNLLTSLILIFPLLVTYQLGVLLTLPMLNGTDFVTVFLLSYLQLTVSQYLIFVASVMVLFVGALVLLKRHEHFQPRVIVPVLLESTIYALTMGSLIVLVMTKLLGIPPQLSSVLAKQGLLSRFVMSLGAGVYEELVFRLGLLGGLVVVFQRLFHCSRWLSVTVAFLVSAIAFSAVHHIPPYGDPFSLNVFTFRVLAGLVFGLLFWFRGLAVAVYTHALYDLYVLLIR